MAKKEKVKAAVLLDCTYGKAGDVIEVDPDEAETSGELDANPAAVEYAESQINKS